MLDPVDHVDERLPDGEHGSGSGQSLKHGSSVERAVCENRQAIGGTPAGHGEAMRVGFFDRLFGAGGGGSGQMITSADVASRGFTETSFREGYDSEEVVEFLNRVVATIDAYERGDVTGVEILSSEQVVNQRFSQTKFRGGWDQDEVDDLLDDVVVTLRSFETPS
jgi:DivIVA domain-containing protein